MIISKVTVGFVTQKYDTDLKRFVNQEFVAADDVSWEDEAGDPLNLVDKPENDDHTEPYLNFDMIQPSNHTFEVGDTVTAKPDSDDNFHEFTGTVYGFRDNGNLITVKDQDDNGWDCRPGQLTKEA